MDLSPFGISSAPEEFQRRLHDVLCGIKGVINIANDITVVGRGTSLADALVDYDPTELELLESLSEHNLRLNPEKVKFKTDTAPFMGHVLTPEALKPSAGIVSAILDMPRPEDKAATCRFIGTINCLFKFCPHLSEVVLPLRDLTHINQAFIWADLHTEVLLMRKI